MRRTDKSLKQLGSKIREMRLEKKLRQEDVETVGLSYKNFQDIELGSVNPTYLTLLKIAKVFGCSVKDLVP